MSEIFLTPDGNMHVLPGGEKTEGISLRDYFAAQALPAFVNNSTFAAAAVTAYKFADAMLEQRKK